MALADGSLLLCSAGAAAAGTESLQALESAGAVGDSSQAPRCRELLLCSCCRAARARARARAGGSSLPSIAAQSPLQGRCRAVLPCLLQHAGTGAQPGHIAAQQHAAAAEAAASHTSSSCCPSSCCPCCSTRRRGDRGGRAAPSAGAQEQLCSCTAAAAAAAAHSFGPGEGEATPQRSPTALERAQHCSQCCCSQGRGGQSRVRCQQQGGLSCSPCSRSSLLSQQLPQGGSRACRVPLRRRLAAEEAACGCTCCSHCAL